MATVNRPAYAFVGSTPTPATSHSRAVRQLAWLITRRSRVQIPSVQRRPSGQISGGQLCLSGEMADAPGLGSGVRNGRPGSSPGTGTQPLQGGSAGDTGKPVKDRPTRVANRKEYKCLQCPSGGKVDAPASEVGSHRGVRVQVPGWARGPLQYGLSGRNPRTQIALTGGRPPDRGKQLAAAGRGNP